MRHCSCFCQRIPTIVLYTSFSFRHARGLSSTSRDLIGSPLLRSILDTETDVKPGGTFEVRNPSNPRQVVGLVPINDREDVEQAIQISQNSLKGWRDETTAATRASFLNRWSRLITEHKKDLATIMTLESGKPLAESLGEVGYATSFLDYYAAEAIRPTSAGGGFITPTPFTTADGQPRGQVLTTQQAVGVTGVITPWNFPLAMITRKVGPALAVGCTAVIKPSELTPLSALALEKLSVEAGLPCGILQVITADRDSTPEVGLALCQSKSVRKISFTGSTAVGKLLMSQCSSTIKKLSLELGGNAPFIVFADADMDIAIEAALASKFRNAGQTCVCADRFLVHESIHKAFVSRLCEKVQQLRVGDGLDLTTNMGPLITKEAADKVQERVRTALDQGAVCEVGGQKVESLGPHFFEPTVLTNVSTDTDVWKQENFGPIVPIRSFRDDDEALELSNDSNVGLASYFCTENLSRVFRMSQRLESGLVGVNSGIISNCVAPFGGVKESGLGREGSALGISEYLETKYTYINV